MDLVGRTALITGAAKRIGRATALALANEQVHIIAHYSRSANEAEELVDTVCSQGGQAWAIAADLREPGRVEHLMDQALAVAGRIDILINNAAVFPESGLRDFAPEELHATVQVNALAPLLLARAFAAQGLPGHIVNFLDCRIVDYDENHVPYHLSKRMLFALTRMMALEFAPAVQVNAVAPGLILPPAGKDEAYLDSLAHTNPLRRRGTTEEVVAAVLFLLRSTFITGQVIFVDGGRHMRGSMYG